MGQKLEQVLRDLTQLSQKGLSDQEKADIQSALLSLYDSQNHTAIDLKYAYDIVNNTKVVIFEWALDIDVPTIYVSENVNQFGYEPKDFYSGALKDYWAFLHPDDLERVKAELYKAREIGDPYYHTYRVITRSGEVRWVEERIVYERDNQGQVTHEKGILLDISQIKALEDQVKISEERYRRIFQNSSVIIVTMDFEGIITAVNDMFFSTLGYTLDQVMNHNIKDFMVDPLNFQWICLGSNQDEQNVDVNFYKEDGSQVVLNLSCKHIHVEGSDIEIVGIDVSEKKKDEAKIRYLSYHDKLTDVYNRAYFDEKFHEMDQSGQYPFSIIIGDMNGLKELNDNYGHKSGDSVLVEVAKIFKASCRNEDIVSRIGGDEFALLCPGVDRQGAQRICDRIRFNCSLVGNDLVDQPSIALGFATKTDHALSLEDLFKAADDQMYKNKMTFKKSTSGMYIGALQTMLEKNSFETRAHTRRMEVVARSVGQSLNMTQDQLDDLSLVALMHDIGKIGIPNDILNKPGILTQEEYGLVKRHSHIGYSILEGVPSMSKLAECVLYHHEKYDGTGYPEGLKGEEIPLISRIIHLVDAYDVMINGCVYKDTMTKQEALEEIKALSGRQFDPLVVTQFIEYMT